MGISKKIAKVEPKMKKTQKNKKAESHLGLHEAKSAKHKAQQLRSKTRGKKKDEGLGKTKSDVAQVSPKDLPSVAKSISPDATTKTLPDTNYLSREEIEKSVVALKDYVKKAKFSDGSRKKNLLEESTEKAVVEVVFKNVPSNNKTYIHTVVLPNHWRLNLEPEDYEIAIFVRHRPAETEAMKILFKKDRDLDISNTHSYYEDLFNKKLDPSMRARISRIISVKELATEFNTFQKMDRLAKTFDMFLSDKQLMSNKLNPLPRRLGRRFWVREKKVPLMVKLDSGNLDERFKRVLSSEPFYVLGRSATEQIQIGTTNQSNDHLIENIQAFLSRLYDLYGAGVRFIRLKTTWGQGLPIYADLDPLCPKVVMKKRRLRSRPVIDDFDMLEEDAKVAVGIDGSVRIIKEKRKEPSEPSTSPVKSAKRSKKA